jgi:GNAT superfamily N-acetyltransferase
MIPAGSINAVFDATQSIKAGASSFCTNFFPVQRKLQEWIDHGELLMEIRGKAAFFLRSDRDFWRFYFCATDAAALGQEIAALPDSRSRRLVTDVVGSETVSRELIAVLTSAGLRPYSRLQRMTRSGVADPTPKPDTGHRVIRAEQSDSKAAAALLERAFDPLADQLPFLREIEAAIAAQQILAVKTEGKVAAILFFETQGFASVVRYWAVDDRFRAKGAGSALMRRYLELNAVVKRFTLWVVADNENAIEKYRHYGYEADGLVDQVLVNDLAAK